MRDQSLIRCLQPRRLSVSDFERVEYMYIQEVIEVEKTVSPKILFWLPNAFPVNDWPVLRWRTAGVALVDAEGAWVARPRAPERATSRNVRCFVRLSIFIIIALREWQASKPKETEDVVGEITEKRSAKGFVDVFRSKNVLVAGQERIWHRPSNVI